MYTQSQRSVGTWDELSLVNLTNQFRSSVSSFRGLSYPTRVATGANTATFDYIPTEKTSIAVERNQLLVIDSGSHYSGK
jgi:Xaa-Pro aminopeptidase